MYERTYGYQYEQVREYSSAAEIAKVMRADIKIAKAEGLLPANWKYSVRSRNFAGGCAIDLTINGPREETMIEEDLGLCPIDHNSRESSCRPNYHYTRLCRGAARMTELAEAAEVTLKRIHGAYNHDGSESQVDYFDVRYYGQVTFEAEYR